MVELTPLSEALVPVRDEHADLIDEVGRWLGAKGGECDPDLIALVLAGCRPFGGDDDGSFELWTRIGVRALMRCGIPNWCSANRTMWPLEMVGAIWTWLDFLDATGRMDPRSDPLWELRKPLICYGGLGFDGLPRPEGDPSPIPCECYIPYRETVAYINGEMERGALIGDVLFWSSVASSEEWSP